MLDATLTEQIRTHLERVTEPVELVAALDDSERSAEMRQLLEETAALSDRVTFVEDDDGADVRRPSFAIRRAGTNVSGPEVSVRFAGVPLGHELTSFILALLQVGGVPPKVDPEVLSAVEALDVDLTFETYYSMSCQVCPDVVQALNTLSILNPRIRHTAIDGAQVPDEVERLQIQAVPAVFADGEHFEQGRVSLEEIVGRLDSSLAERATAAISEKDPFDVLVVGGGPAGSAAAIYAARKGIRVGVVAERFGGQLLETMSIENFLSVPATEGPRLAAAMEAHVGEHDVDVMTLQRAKRLVPAAREGGLVTVELESGASLRARSVILSTGARWRHVNVPGEDEYRNQGVAYCPHCDGPLFKDKRVAVIGGGNSGIEAAIDLAGICSQVQVIEFDDQLRADAVLQDKLASLDNVEVAVSAATTEILGDGSTVTGLVADDRATGEERRYELDGVFVQIGLLPNTEWLDGDVELTDRGEIVIDDRGRTSMPGVFAAGDCTTVPYKQIMIAMGAGSVAALSAFDHLIRTSVSTEADDGAEAPSRVDDGAGREPAAVG